MLNRNAIVNSVAEYFSSHSWKKAVDLFRDPEMRHSHLFIDSTLNLESIRDVMCAYLEKEFGKVLDVIDLFTNNVDGPAVVHTIYPTNTPSGGHMDVMVHYVPGTILVPAPREHGQENHSILAWRVKDHLDFVDNFVWRKMGHKENEEINMYFMESDQWKTSIKQATKPDWVHFHTNIETNINPFDLEKYIYKEIEKKGWNCHHTVHTIFPATYRGYTGKIVFILTKPRKCFDIIWINNPDVVIRPSTVPVGYRHGPWTMWFDIQYLEEYKRWLEGKEFITLSEDEIEFIVAAR